MKVEFNESGDLVIRAENNTENMALKQFIDLRDKYGEYSEKTPRFFIDVSVKGNDAQDESQLDYETINTPIPESMKGLAKKKMDECIKNIVEDIRSDGDSILYPAKLRPPTTEY